MWLCLSVSVIVSKCVCVCVCVCVWWGGYIVFRYFQHGEMGISGKKFSYTVVRTRLSEVL